MSDIPAKVTEGLAALVQPYLGQRGYGGLIIYGDNSGRFPSCEDENKVIWSLSYHALTFYDDFLGGKKSAILATFNRNDGKFGFSRAEHDETTETDDPQQAVDYFRVEIGAIKISRHNLLLAHAITRKQDMVRLEAAIAEVRRFADANRQYGPTAEEIEEYQRYYSQLMTKKWE